MSSTESRAQPQEESLTWLSSYTKDPVFNREHERMRAQHVFVRATMQDRLICAPIKTTPTSPDLQILDSACNDGTWMLDVIANRTAQLRIPVDAKLNFLGTDLDKKHFSSLDLDSALPSNVSLAFQVQDITQPWPENICDRFDLVHQRFALQYLGDSDEGAQKAVARMVALAKPGTGSIQLIEASLVAWAEGSSVSLLALQQAKQMTMEFCANLSINLYSHKCLGRWLKEASAVDIEVKEFKARVGGKTELARKGLKNLLDFLGTQKVVTAEWEQFGHSGEEYDNVIRELEDYFETRQEEVVWTFVGAWGRRPDS
jgi:hypothetical protein